MNEEEFLNDVKQKVSQNNFSTTYQIKGDFSKETIMKAFELGLSIYSITQYNKSYIDLNMCKKAITKYPNHIFNMPRELVNIDLFNLCLSGKFLPSIILVQNRFSNYMTKEIYIKYIKDDGDNFRFINSNRIDFDLCKIALENEGKFEYIPIQFRNNLELVNLALKNKDYHYLNRDFLYKNYSDKIIEEYQNYFYNEIIEFIKMKNLSYNDIILIINKIKFPIDKHNELIDFLNKNYKHK
jgi:hypothetical protein